MKHIYNEQTFYCLHPWYSLDIGYSGYAKVGCCPYKGRPLKLKNIKNFSISGIWNSQWFQKLRQNSCGTDRIPSGCMGCSQYIRNENFNVPGNLLPIQSDNLSHCISDAKANIINVNSFPSRYNLCFTPKCNIKCIMCSQHDARSVQNIELSSQMLLSQKDILARATSIFVSGGEPMVSEQCIDFIEALCSDPLLQHVKLDIVTNGLLLPKIFHLIENKKQLSLHISLDGIGANYEKVRRGGSWKILSANIEKILSLSQGTNKDWEISTSCILMRSTIEGLPDYIQWCLDRNIGIVLQQLMSTRKTRDEDLKMNPDLLHMIPNWQEQIDKSIHLLEIDNKSGQANTLRQFKTDLLAAPTKKNRKKYDALADDALASHKNKRVMIWGTGTNYQWCWASTLNKFLPEIKFLGFIDNDPEKWETTIDGFRVYKPEILKEKLEPEVIIIAAQIIWREEIIQQIRKLCPKVHII